MELIVATFASSVIFVILTLLGVFIYKTVGSVAIACAFCSYVGVFIGMAFQEGWIRGKEK